MLNVLDEFTGKCLVIRTAWKLKSTDVIDVPSELSILRGVPVYRHFHVMGSSVACPCINLHSHTERLGNTAEAFSVLGADPASWDVPALN